MTNILTKLMADKLRLMYDLNFRLVRANEQLPARFVHATGAALSAKEFDEFPSVNALRREANELIRRAHETETTHTENSNDRRKGTDS